MRWRETLLAMRAIDVESFVELGPGAVLTGMVKRTLRVVAGMKAGVFGIGAAVPPDVITNAHFEARLDTTDAWIVKRTGIQRAPGSTAARRWRTWPSTPARTRWPTPGAAPTRSTG